MYISPIMLESIGILAIDLLSNPFSKNGFIAAL
jgi:hypothetical protein